MDLLTFNPYVTNDHYYTYHLDTSIFNFRIAGIFKFHKFDEIPENSTTPHETERFAVSHLICVALLFIYVRLLENRLPG